MLAPTHPLYKTPQGLSRNIWISLFQHVYPNSPDKVRNSIYPSMVPHIDDCIAVIVGGGVFCGLFFFLTYLPSWYIINSWTAGAMLNSPSYHHASALFENTNLIEVPIA